MLALSGIRTYNRTLTSWKPSSAGRHTFVLRCFHNNLSVSDVLKRLLWPSLEQRRRIACLSMLYKAQNILVCLDDITRLLQPLPPRKRHGHDQQLVLLQWRQQCHKMLMSFLPRTFAHWNDLPQAAVEAKTTDTFVAQVSRLQLFTPFLTIFIFKDRIGLGIVRKCRSRLGLCRFSWLQHLLPLSWTWGWWLGSTYIFFNYYFTFLCMLA